MGRYDEDDERWMSAETRATRKLGRALLKVLPEEIVVEIIDGVDAIVEAAKSDLDDQINQRGQYDPDW